MSDRSDSARLTDVLRTRVFRILYPAELQSIFGDQLARVALSVLVFSRTGSDSATALTYGLTYLPAVLGGLALARIGDRWSRRAVMIVLDVLRAAMFALMAIPGLPLPAVGALLVVAVFVGPAFSASAVSLLAAELTGAQFRTASGLRMTTNQLAQVVGFAVGGVLTAALGADNTLLLNAATYLVSAIAITIGLRRRIPGATGSVLRTNTQTDAAASQAAGAPNLSASVSLVRLMSTVMRDRTARTMLLLSLLAGVFITPESLAIPFAAQIGASTRDAGVLLATIPLGSAVGVSVLMWLVPAARRPRVALAMAATTGVPLAFTAVRPGLALAGVLWFLSGVAAAYQVEVFVTFVRWAPDAVRARLVSVCGSLLLGAQGLGPVIFGAIASASTPALAVGAAGVVGTAAALVATATSSQRFRQGAHRRVKTRPAP